MVEKGFEDFKKTELSEFFAKNKQMLGFTYKEKSLVIAVHEYVTNSLDNCIEAGILPNIKVEIKYDDSYKDKPDAKNHLILTVEDNGTGIPEKFLPTIFAKLLQGSKFGVNLQKSGSQGIGGTAVTLFSLMTSGKPVFMTTGDGKTAKDVEININIHTGEALNKIIKKYPSSFKGTKLITHLGDVNYGKGKASVDEYLKLMWLANPFSNITFINPDEVKTDYKRITTEMPSQEKELPHPLGLSAHDLLSLFEKSKHNTFGEFFVKDLQKTSKGILKNIEEATNMNLENLTKSTITFKQAEQILDAITKVRIQKPSSKNIMPIGEKVLEKSLQELFQPEFSVVITRPPKVFRGGIPFQVEIALGWAGNCGKQSVGNEFYESDLIRFANRTPLLFDLSHDVIYDIFKNINIKNYIKIGTENIPMSIIVNVNSPSIPFTGPSKMAIDDVDEIRKEVTRALFEGLKKISVFVNKKHKELILKNAKEKLSSYVEIISESLEEASEKYKTKEDISEHLGKIIKNKI